MNSLRDLLARPLREQHPLVLAALALAVVLAALAILTTGGDDRSESDRGSERRGGRWLVTNLASD